jgi:hypothetical protein
MIIKEIGNYNSSEYNNLDIDELMNVNYLNSNKRLKLDVNENNSKNTKILKGVEISIEKEGKNSKEKEKEKESKEKEYLDNYVFGEEDDRCIISNTLCDYCMKVVKNVVVDYRRRNKIETDETMIKKDKFLDSKLMMILKKAQEVLRIRKCEMIHALILFMKLYTGHGESKDFQGGSYVDVIFYYVTVMIISNKWNADVPFQNGVWRSVANLSLLTLDQCEAHTLKLLNYGINISRDEYVNFKRKYLSNV